MTTDEPLRVAIVGCGLIGRKRANALGSSHLVACADVVEERARDLAGSHPEAKPYTDWRHMLATVDADVVIVSATNNILAEATLAAVQSDRHVLVEKPAARNAAELTPVIEAAQRADVRVRVGFNHRYHPGLLKARELCDAGALGQLMFVRGRYGHGGRLGYENEWRADPELSGGGELLDQGAHLIDLARWFLGDLEEVSGFAHTYFWPMPVEDNGFLLLKTADQKVAFLHASCTEWKNLFSFEIYGRNAKLHVEGLGGSYGMERLAYYKMLPEMGPPEVQMWEYPGPDMSWEVEFSEFEEDIQLKRSPAPGLEDARAVLSVVEKIYRECGYDYHA